MNLKLQFIKWLMTWEQLINAIVGILTLGFRFTPNLKSSGLFWDEWFRLHPDDNENIYDSE